MATHSTNAGSQAKPRRRIMRALKINEISAVDVPAQEGAVAVIMKRRGEPLAPDPQTEELDVEKGAALTTAADGHAHLLALIGHGGDPINSGMTSWVDEHSHPWIRNEADEVVIGMASRPDGEAHEHGIGEMSKDVGTQEDPMADKDKTPEELHASVDDLTKKLARADAIAALDDVERMHFVGLKDAAVEDEFLAKSHDERVKVATDAVEKKAKDATDSDPVEYTTKDGVEMRKSAGSGFIAMAKSNDALRDQVAKLVDGSADATFQKRAEIELAHLPGDVASRAAMLKAVEGIEDETQRATALGALKAQNESMEMAFKTYGHLGEVEPGSAGDELDKLAKAAQKEDSITYEAAFSKVLETDRGSELYSKTITVN